MPRGKRISAEQIVSKLRQAEVELAKGVSIEEACRRISISPQSYYRWRKEYGGMEIDQAKKYKELEKENTRLKKLVAELSLDKQMLEEVARGNF